MKLGSIPFTQQTVADPKDLFLLYEVMMRRGEKRKVLFHPENRLSPWEPCWSMHKNPNKRVSDKTNSVIRVVEFRKEGAKVIFLLVFPGYIS